MSEMSEERPLLLRVHRRATGETLRIQAFTDGNSSEREAGAEDRGSAPESRAVKVSTKVRLKKQAGR